MRYLGTVMLLAGVAMLLLPGLWERHAGRDPSRAEAAAGTFPGASTLRMDDLIPEWRGPAPRTRTDG
jgi:hypothetical protein